MTVCLFYCPEIQNNWRDVKIFIAWNVIVKIALSSSKPIDSKYSNTFNILSRYLWSNTTYIDGFQLLLNVKRSIWWFIYNTIMIQSKLLLLEISEFIGKGIFSFIIEHFWWIFGTGGHYWNRKILNNKTNI